MKQILALLVSVLMFVGCEPPKYPNCDYCKAPRQDARPYMCRKCSKTHASCSTERPLHVIDVKADKEGFAAGRSVKTCPE